MSAYEEQIIANANAIQAIINNAKSIPQLPNLDETIPASSEIGIYDSNGTLTGRITVAELALMITAQQAAIGWFWNATYNCWVEKDVANSNQVEIEANDLVYEKDVDNGGVTVTLRGWRYDGGDRGLIASYTKIKIYA